MGRNPKLTDHEILDRAMATMWRHGPSEVSIRDLEAELGMRAPSIYRRFGSKERLQVAVVDHYADRVITRRLARHLDRSDDPLADVARFLERSVTEAEDGAGLIGCLVTTAGIEGRSHSPDLRRALERGRRRIEEGFTDAIQRASDVGLLAPHATVEGAVAVLTLAMQGLMAMARAGAPAAELRACARAAVSTLRAPGPRPDSDGVDGRRDGAP